jgi:hypothetical protein
MTVEVSVSRWLYIHVFNFLYRTTVKHCAIWGTSEEAVRLCASHLDIGNIASRKSARPNVRAMEEGNVNDHE